MIKCVVCWTGGERGWPITATRHYAQLPLANTPLIRIMLNQLKKESLVLINPKNETLRTFLEKEQIPYSTDPEVLADAELIIPGDIFLTKSPAGFAKGALLTIPGGSEEEDAARALLESYGIKYLLEDANALRVNYPWELLTANRAALQNLSTKENTSPESDSHDDRRKTGTVIEENVLLKGEVIIGAGSVIKSGSYIEGPVIIGKNCTIGPMAHIRPDTSIADGCTIGKSEVYDSVIMRGSVSKHQAYIGHSVIGEDVNVGAFTVTADYRHDGQEHKVWVAGEKVESGRRKVGAFIGDHARIAISTSFYPGRKLGPGQTTLPGEVMQKDKK